MLSLLCVVVITVVAPIVCLGMIVSQIKKINGEVNNTFVLIVNGVEQSAEKRVHPYRASIVPDFPVAIESSLPPRRDEVKYFSVTPKGLLIDRRG